ncbi:MAG: hypothetical protein ACO1OB_27350 [Archangium sp.]
MLTVPPPPPPPEPAFLGTITYESVERDGSKFEWKVGVLSSGSRLELPSAGRVFVDADGVSWKKADDGKLVSEAPRRSSFVKATELGKRTIAGRDAHCLTMPGKPRYEFPFDTVEACIFWNLSKVRFSALPITAIVDADLDAAFAAYGWSGLPASIVLKNAKATFSALTATKADARDLPAPLTREQFLGIEATAAQTSLDACVEQRGLGEHVVKALYAAEMAYRAEHDRYEKDLKKLGFVMPRGIEGLYDVSFKKLEATKFIGVATGKGKNKGDVWTVNELNEVQHLEKTPCR